MQGKGISILASEMDKGSIEILKTKEGERYLEIRYEPDYGWIRCTWFGNVPIEYITEGVRQYQSLLKKTHCAKLLNDNSHFESNWIPLNDWLEEKEGMTESAKNGLKYMAHVNSSRFITRFSAADLGTRVRDFEFKIFEDLKDAEDWLHTVPDE